MSELAGAPPQPYDSPAVPTSAWALGWSFVVGQVLDLAERGPQDAAAWPLSMVIGAALIVLISHGVMRVRPVRFWLVVILLVLAPVLQGVGLVADPTGWGLAAFALSVVQLGLLRAYSRTAWCAWQRTRPAGGPSLVPILALAALVGALGGVLGASTNGVSLTVHF